MLKNNMFIIVQRDEVTAKQSRNVNLNYGIGIVKEDEFYTLCILKVALYVAF